MAEQLMKELEDDLTCSICQERFKNPKVLPCMHTFCQECLDTYANKLGGKEISCPTCRRECKLPEGVKGLQANFYFVNLGEKLDLYKKLDPSEQSSASCGMCNESQSKPEVYCADCNFGICSKCKVLHSRIPQTSEHDLIPFGGDALTKFSAVVKKDKVPSCTRHVPEKLRFFCKTCSQLICRECTIVQHKEPHQIVEAATEFQNVKTKLTGLLQSSEAQMSKTTQYLKDGEAGRENMEKELEKLQTEMGARYDNVMASFEKQLKGHLEREKRKATDAHKLKVATVGSSVEQAENWVKSMKCTQEMATKVVEEANEYEVLGMSNDLFSSFNDLKGELDQFTWEKSNLEMGMIFLPEEIPNVEFGCCRAAGAIANDLVAVTYDQFSHDGFILCRLDKTKPQVTFTQLNQNGQVKQSNRVAIAQLPSKTDSLVVHTDKNRQNVLVGFREWLLIVKFSQMGKIHTILKMRPKGGARIAAICIVGSQSLVFLYEDDPQSLYLCNNTSTLEQYLCRPTSPGVQINLASEAQNYERHGAMQKISLTRQVRTITAVAVPNVNILLYTTLERNNKIVVINLGTRDEFELVPPKPANEANAEIIDILHGHSNGPQYLSYDARGMQVYRYQINCAVLWGSKVESGSEKWSYVITENSHNQYQHMNTRTWRVPPESGRPRSCYPNSLAWYGSNPPQSLKICDDTGKVFICTQ